MIFEAAATLPLEQKIENDLIGGGSKGWDSLGDMLSMMNRSLDYVVLRNFEVLPDNYYADDHGDIDVLVNDIEDGMIQVVPLTHRPQGQWTTNELGGGTYLAPVHFRTGEANLTWVQPQQCELYAKQLRDETITEALREVDRLVA